MEAEEGADYNKISYLCKEWHVSQYCGVMLNAVGVTETMLQVPEGLKTAL